MSIDNLPQTARGDFRLRNLTHYNTEDILRLMNAIEKERPLSTFSFALNVQRTTVPGMQKVLELREFTGTPRTDARTERLRLLANTRWKQPLVFRLLPPDKLYSNPLQTLSEAGGEGIPKMPSDMVVELAAEIEGLYRATNLSTRKNVISLKVEHMTIRIEPKRAKGNKKQGALARHRELLHNAYLEVKYREGLASKALEHLNEAASRIMIAAKALGIEDDRVQRIADDGRMSYRLIQMLPDIAEDLARQAQEKVDAC
jgi:hypothetical protein